MAHKPTHLAALLPLAVAVAVVVIARHRQARLWVRLVNNLGDGAELSRVIELWRDVLLCFA